MNTCTIIYRKPRASLSSIEQPLAMSFENKPRSVLSLQRSNTAQNQTIAEAQSSADERLKVPGTPKERKLQLLRDNWPALFCITRPLKIGIRDDLIEDAQVRQLPIAASDIKRSLRVWISRRVYLKAMVFGEGRYDLTGKRVQSLSEEHRLHARRMLDQIDQQFDVSASKFGRPVLMSINDINLYSDQ